MRQFLPSPWERTRYDYSHVFDVKEGVHEQLKNMKHDYQKYHNLLVEVCIAKLGSEKIWWCFGRLLPACCSNCGNITVEKNAGSRKWENAIYHCKESTSSKDNAHKHSERHRFRYSFISQLHHSQFSNARLTKGDLFQCTCNAIGKLEAFEIKIIAIICDESRIIVPLLISALSKRKAKWHLKQSIHLLSTDQ